MAKAGRAAKAAEAAKAGKTATAGRPRKAARKITPAAILAARAAAPTQDELRDELIHFWDAFTGLNAASIRMAYDAGNSLEDIGIGEDVSKTFANKYNSVILRAPGRGPLVTQPEAIKWAAGKMSVLVGNVFKRATP